MNDEPIAVIQTFVWRDKKCFHVSTIERSSSAPAAYGYRYNETIAWECDPDLRTKREMICSADDLKGSILTHQRIVKEIYEKPA